MVFILRNFVELLHLLNTVYPFVFVVTSLDCLVADWGQWSPCSKTCGFGRMTRHRVVIQEAQNGGHVCPPLTETEMCGSMRNCRWGHFKWGSVKRKRNHFRF